MFKRQEKIDKEKNSNYGVNTYIIWVLVKTLSPKKILCKNGIREVSRTETYGNVSIYYSDGRSILYFKDKVCYPLIDAYNNGFVTEDEISKIATAFYNMS